MNNLAPIAIFAYNRPLHLESCIKALSKSQIFLSSKVFIFFDGPRNSEDAFNVNEVRRVAKELLKDDAQFIYRDKNAGLSTSIIEGVSNILKCFNKVIVLEDDLLAHEDFLSYMNHALSKYEKDSNVFQISGHTFDSKYLYDSNAIFLPFTTSWGWGTWKRSWDIFDLNANGWDVLLSDHQLRKKFNLDGSYNFSQMLIKQMGGGNDSWAIRWYWSVFIRNGLVLFPPFSLIQNIGFDGSGTNGMGKFRNFNKKSLNNKNTQIVLPEKSILINDNYVQMKKSIFKSNGGHLGRIIDFIKKHFY